MTIDVIEGEATEMEEPRALAVVPPIGLARAQEPDELIAMATKWAKALADIVERQHLYATISGKKYPQVEAWMTVGRMDNVVAREASPPIRHEDGSYEATCELVRLSDGAVVGRGSALCGTPDDRPWNGRGEPQRRSMAATRAMSRAFRAQYSWIMVLAGYQPTPADEMPMEGDPVPHPVSATPPERAERHEPWLDVANVHLSGIVTVGKPPADGNRRINGEDVPHLLFALDTNDGRTIPQCVAEGPLCDDLFDATEGGATLPGLRVTVEGDIWRIPWQKAGKWMAHPFQRLLLTRIEWADPDGVLVQLPMPREAESLELPI